MEDSAKTDPWDFDRTPAPSAPEPEAAPAALAATSVPGSALSQALSVASLINGPILGVFLVGTLLKRVSQPPAVVGMIVSIGSMLYIFLATKIAWTWYVFIGSLITVVVAWLASFALQAEVPRLTQVEEE